MSSVLIQSTTETLGSFWDNPKVGALFDRAIQLAMDEDLGWVNPIDLTTRATVSDDVVAVGGLYCKQAAVIAGLDVFQRVLFKYDNRIKVSSRVKDGHVSFGREEQIAAIEGPAGPLLTGERVALNLIQRMSGVATLTRKFTELADGTGIKILDTRKTTPGLRIFEKYAVLVGGGVNHRFGLNEAVLIKDNHIRIAGGVTKAVLQAKKNAPNAVIEVETCTLEEVQEALTHNVSTIMLDNMTPQMVEKAVAIIDGKTQVEVSGGVNQSNIQNYLIPGVTAISIGALTHSASNIDMSVEIETFAEQ